jgi:polysaccharide biosynthesis/export protein
MLCSGSKRARRMGRGLCLVLMLCSGCSTLSDAFDSPATPTCEGDVSHYRAAHEDRKAVPNLPHELAQVSLPTYVIEAPDVLLIDALRLIPKPPYRIHPLDVLGIQVVDPLPLAPIASLYPVDPDGTVNLGYSYGKIRVEGLTVDEARMAIYEFLKARPDETRPGKIKELTPDRVTVVLAESRGLQQIRGPHLVRPDGTIGLGLYGSVFVDGMTIDEARAAIEAHLSQFIVQPEISVDISGFNSKVYYVVTDGGGSGQQIARLPMMGKTTVLDAVSQISGLSPVSSKHCIYLVRPTPAGCKEGEEIYKIAWNDIVHRGHVGTNYQVLPGDRIYVGAQPLVTIDTELARFLAPFERLFADVGLGNATVRSFLVPVPRNSTATNIFTGF